MPTTTEMTETIEPANISNSRKTTKRNPEQWWQATKADPTKLAQWLRRQYAGEIAAVNLLSQVLIRFGDEATPREWRTIHKIMCQEARTMGQGCA